MLGVMQPPMACPGRRLKAILRNGLVAYLPMNEGDGDKVFDRSVGGEHTGTLINGPTWVVTEKGWALGFNGSNYVTLPSEFVPSVALGRTLSAWVLSNALDSIDGIMGMGAGWQWRLRGDAAGDFLQYTHSAVADVNSNSNPLTVGVWAHIALVWDGVTAQHYVDGVPWGSGALNSYNIASTNARLGSYGSSARRWNGRISNAVIYDRALTLAEIELLAFDPYEEIAGLI